MRATCGSPSPGSTPTRASRPGPIAPTVSPSMVTRASVTRWIRASMRTAVRHRDCSLSPRLHTRRARDADEGQRAADTLKAMADLIARILFFLAALLTRLPWPWLLRLGDGVATVMLRRN